MCFNYLMRLEYYIHIVKHESAAILFKYFLYQLNLNKINSFLVERFTQGHIS